LVEVEDELDTSGDKIVAEFEQKLTQLELLLVSKRPNLKMRPNTTEEWVTKLATKL